MQSNERKHPTVRAHRYIYISQKLSLCINSISHLCLGSYAPAQALVSASAVSF